MHFFHSIWKNLHLTENFYTDISVVSVTNMRYAPDPLCGKTLLGRVNIQQSAPPIVVTEDPGDDSKDDNGDKLS